MGDQQPFAVVGVERLGFALVAIGGAAWATLRLEGGWICALPALVLAVGLVGMVISDTRGGHSP